MEQEEIATLAHQVEKDKKELRDKWDRWEMLNSISSRLPQPKGMWFWRRCPLCGGKTSKESLQVESRIFGAIIIMTNYACLECEYEYVTRHTESF